MEVIPNVGFGTYRLPNDSSTAEAVRFAIVEAGFRHIDAAYYYKNQTHVGVGIKAALSTGKVKREELWITSKIWPTFLVPDQVEANFMKTLSQLQLDYIDLFLIHWPASFENAPGTEDILIKEGQAIIRQKNSVIPVWIELQKLVQKGLIKHIGVSNFSIEMLEKMRFAEGITIQPYCNQVEYHLYMQQEALRRYCEFRGIYLCGHTTLGSSTWKERGKPHVLGDPELIAISKELGKNVGPVLIRFLQQLSPMAVPLTRSSNPEHIKENNQLNFSLSEEQMERLKKCERCYRFVQPVNMWNVDIFSDGW